MDKKIKIEDLKKKGIIKKELFEYNDDFLEADESEEKECLKK